MDKSLNHCTAVIEEIAQVYCDSVWRYVIIFINKCIILGIVTGGDIVCIC